jgi:hypothetical protein
MRYATPIPYDLVLLITEVLAVLLAAWIVWTVQTPSLA